MSSTWRAIRVADYALLSGRVKIRSLHAVDWMIRRPRSEENSMSVLVAGPGSISQGKPAAHWWAALVRYFTANPAVVTADTGGLVIPKRVPPKNYEYLQDAAMRRAMERL